MVVFPITIQLSRCLFNCEGWILIVLFSLVKGIDRLKTDVFFNIGSLTDETCLRSSFRPSFVLFSCHQSAFADLLVSSSALPIIGFFSLLSRVFLTNFEICYKFVLAVLLITRRAGFRPIDPVSSCSVVMDQVLIRFVPKCVANYRQDQVSVKGQNIQGRESFWLTFIY